MVDGSIAFGLINKAILVEIQHLELAFHTFHAGCLELLQTDFSITVGVCAHAGIRYRGRGIFFPTWCYLGQSRDTGTEQYQQRQRLKYRLRHETLLRKRTVSTAPADSHGLWLIIHAFFCETIMLSYRHAFHAGNHADVLKHWVYSLVLAYFNQKDKPYWVMDTHAGAGAYRLDQAIANKTAEYVEGIARLQAASLRPDAFDDYLQAVQALQTAGGHKQLYPGSPRIASHFLRESDKLRLFELHPADFALLEQGFADAPKRQVQAQCKDGFEGVKACLPPPTKRGLVLIDPPYELKADYERVVDCMRDSLKRFATGTYLIWYPILQRPEPMQMIQKLKALQTDYLHVQLEVSAPSAEGFGMHGSGMFVINPPWNLAAAMQPALDWLSSTLAQDTQARARLEVQQR